MSSLGNSRIKTKIAGISSIKKDDRKRKKDRHLQKEIETVSKLKNNNAASKEERRISQEETEVVSEDDGTSSRRIVGSKQIEVDLKQQEKDMLNEIRRIANERLEESEVKKKISVSAEEQTSGHLKKIKRSKKMKNKFEAKAKKLRRQALINEINELINNSPSMNGESEDEGDEGDEEETGAVSPTTSIEERIRVLKEQINILESMAHFVKDK